MMRGTEGQIGRIRKGEEREREREKEREKKGKVPFVDLSELDHAGPSETLVSGSSSSLLMFRREDD